MSISIQKYTKSNEQSWDEFVLSSSNGTIFHLRSFLSYHIDRKFEDHSLIFKNNNSIIAIFPAARIKNKNVNILHSHPGASYGGFVYNNLSYEEGDEIIQAIYKYCKKNLFHKIFFIPSPATYESKTNDIINYLLHWHKYEIAECYISSTIKINKNKNALEYLNKRKKRYIQNYIQNDDLIIKHENNFHKFYPILLENKKKHNVLPTHSLKEIIKLNKQLPGKLNLLLLYYNEKIIGGTLNIIANDNCGIVFYNMINYEFQEMQPASIQIYESINWAIKCKLKFLDLGVSQISSETNPISPHKSLILFKEQFGSIAIIRKAYQKIIS